MGHRVNSDELQQLGLPIQTFHFTNQGGPMLDAQTKARKWCNLHGYTVGYTIGDTGDGSDVVVIVDPDKRHVCGYRNTQVNAA